MKCPKCGVDNEKGAVTCSSCDAEMPKEKKRFKEIGMNQVAPPDMSKYSKKPGEK